MPNPADGSFCRSCATPIALVEPTYAQQPYTPQQEWQSPDQTWQQPYHWQEPAGHQQWQQTPFGGPLQAPLAQPFQPAPSNRPAIALVLVLLGFLCCGPILSVPGAILGWLEIKAIKEGRAPESGMTLSQIAFWGGIAVTALSLIGIVLGIIFNIIGAIGQGL